jgi:hypothetical protein
MTEEMISTCTTAGIAGSGFKSLDEGEKVAYEVTRDKKGLQAVNVSKSSNDKGSNRSDIRSTEDLRVPLEVEDAGRVLAKHFDPEDLYWAMVDARRRA